MDRPVVRHLDDRAVVRKLDTAGKVLTTTVASSILPALSVPEEHTEWGYLLPKYATAARQLDALWNDMDPLVSLSLPVPRKPVPPTAFPIPNVLSAMVPPEDVEAQPAPDPSWSDTQEERQMLEEHNTFVGDLVRHFEEAVVATRQSEGSAAAAAARKRKIDRL